MPPPLVVINASFELESGYGRTQVATGMPAVNDA
jgi:hypothetical protein